MTAHELPEGVFFSESNVAIRYQVAQPEWMLERLSEAVWGTEGLRYRLSGIELLLKTAPHIGWVILEEHGEPIGSLGVLRRSQVWNGEVVDTAYLSVLVVKSDKRRRGFARTLLKETRNFLRVHLSRGVTFAFVEVDNKASASACMGAGYELGPTIDLVTFARKAPRPSVRVRRLEEKHLPEVLGALEQMYGQHELFDGSASLDPQYCWGVVENGQLLAVVQAEPRRTELVDLGYGGWLERALPWLPVLRELVKPSDYRFVWIQHVWFGEGHARAAFELMEGVLHATEHRLAALQWDPRSPVFRSWRRGGRLGPLAPFTQRFHVMLDRIGVDQARAPFVLTSRAL